MGKQKKTCPHCGTHKYVTRKSKDGMMVCRACENGPIHLVNGDWYKKRGDAPEYQLCNYVKDQFDLPDIPLDTQYNKARLMLRGADIFLGRCDNDLALAKAVIDETVRDDWVRRHCDGLMFLNSDKIFWGFLKKAKMKLAARQERMEKERVREENVAPESLSEW